MISPGDVFVIKDGSMKMLVLFNENFNGDLGEASEGDVIIVLCVKKSHGRVRHETVIAFFSSRCGIVGWTIEKNIAYNCNSVIQLQS